MPAEGARLRIRGRQSEREVDLSLYLDARAAETAEREANQWIKSLRHARVDGLPFRDRFTHRGDSLWWFAELYLHKLHVAASILRSVSALERLMAEERPAALSVVAGDDVVRVMAPLVAARHRTSCEGGIRTALPATVRLGLSVTAALHAASAAADRLRPGSRVSPPGTRTDVAAFVHSAFWRGAAGSADEGYIGPVLRELLGQVPADRLRLVGVGPRTNFRVRRWRHRLAEFGDPQARAIPLMPVEAYASWKAIRPSFAWWTARGSVRRSLLSSGDLREAAVIHGYDAWPLVRQQLTGISLLQLPWSARAMDEAGAALDALEPAAVVTYAEAGGWGRALVLEARRRGIRSVGLQHGFIYRHWLNYLHEADEMAPSTGNAADRGFPRPDLTLVYDEFAAGHLEAAGAFPRSALRVVGSPRLDSFVAASRRLTGEDRERVRVSVGARPDQQLVVVAAKYSQIARVFGDLVRAAGAMPDVRLVVKVHPAETAAPYQAAAAGIADIAVAPANADLATLVSAARLIVTVNSTAALEAMPLGVPALVLALPNNLSPFVDAGAMAGVERAEEIGPALTSVLYDEKRRAALAAGRQAVMSRFGISPDGGAAVRAAAAIVDLVHQSRQG